MPMTAVKNRAFISRPETLTLRIHKNKAIRNELDGMFAASCTYGPAPSEFYGTGATVVTIR